jgi:hypothetical protein
MTQLHHETIQFAYSSLAMTSTDTDTEHLIHFNLGQRSRIAHILQSSQTLRGALQELQDASSLLAQSSSRRASVGTKPTFEKGIQVSVTNEGVMFSRTVGNRVARHDCILGCV